MRFRFRNIVGGNHVVWDLGGTYDNETEQPKYPEAINAKSVEVKRTPELCPCGNHVLHGWLIIHSEDPNGTILNLKKP